MLTKLWTGLDGKLAERLVLVLLSPAATFWSAGALARLDALPSVGHWRTELDEAGRQISALPAAAQLLLVLGAIGLLTVSGSLVNALSLPALRLMEGYWPGILAGPRRILVDRQARRRASAANRWRALLLRGEESLSPEETNEAIRLDHLVKRIPPTPAQQMPTRLGNVLRAAESRPARKYGLDPVVCWPHLWLLLPDTVREEIALARAALDRAATWMIWGLLFLVWTPWSAWAVPLALVVLTLSYLSTLRAATAYADLVEAAWDLHRSALYSALRWPLPDNPASEFAAGRAVTTYLRRGGRGPLPRFGQDPSEVAPPHGGAPEETGNRRSLAG
ncbi:hypothetical protein AB0F18_19325 [Streptomyces sp. NPDC029216]|uniref:hypothetical protein n=1 Tax=Streptomyces sp. NPDC029216 TaxID=3154701 RepID=UPI0033CE32F4